VGAGDRGACSPKLNGTLEALAWFAVVVGLPKRGSIGASHKTSSLAK
jgi:hypothetical protein